MSMGAMNDEADEFLVISQAKRCGRGLSATEIALAATAYQRRPSIKHLKWLGTKIAERMIAKGKLARQGDRFVVSA